MDRYAQCTPNAQTIASTTMIRITGGSLCGRILPCPVPAGVRPTSARTREALFSMVGQDLNGWSMLDLFGGTGLIAIEAASRGASPLWIIEKNPKTASMIRKNLQELKVQATLLTQDALTITLMADLVFADPPYALPLDRWLPVAAGLSRRVLAAEASAEAIWPEEIEKMHLTRKKIYGDSSLALYEPAQPADAG